MNKIIIKNCNRKTNKNHFKFNLQQDGDDQIISTLSDRFDTDHPKVEHLSIANIDKPDIAFASQLGRMDQFSLFVPHHKDMASSLIDVFLAAKDAKQLMAWAVYAHDRVNPLMFNYALSVAMLNR